MHAQVAHGMGDVQREVRELLDTPSGNGEAAAVSTPGSEPPVRPETGSAPGPADPPMASAGDPLAAGATRAVAQGHSAERGALEPGQDSAAAASAAAPAQQPSSSSAGQQDSLALQHSGRGAPQASGAAGSGRGSASGQVSSRDHSGGGSSSGGGPAADSSASNSDESEGSIIGFDTEALAPAERCAAAAAGELLDAARAAVCLHFDPKRCSESAFLPAAAAGKLMGMPTACHFAVLNSHALPLPVRAEVTLCHVSCAPSCRCKMKQPRLSKYLLATDLYLFQMQLLHTYS